MLDDTVVNATDISTESRPHEQSLETDGFRFWDTLSILYKRKRLIMVLAATGCVLALAVALLLPNTYTATAVILPPEKQQSSANALIGQLGPLAAAAGADFGMKSPSELYIGILGSRTIADRLIERFQLRSAYRTRTETDTRDKLKAHTRFNSGKDSLIRIAVQDWDPGRAAAIANAYVAELEFQNKRMAVTEASQRRIFLEKQLVDEKLALATAEGGLKKTQQRTGVIDLGGQSELAIASLAQIRAQVTAGEVSLERLKMGATSQNPEVIQAEAELEALRAQLRRLDNSSYSGGSLVAASAIPQSGLDYVRSLREVKYHEFLFELLSKQYEAARLDESKASPSLQILDSAVPPDKKSGPPRTAIVLLGSLSGGALAMLIALIQWRKSWEPLRT